jgi:ribonuclease P protein component
VFRRGRRFYSPYFTLFYLPHPTLEISPVVSKKVARRAVARNKIKRRIRHLGRLYFQNGRIVVVAKRDLGQVEFKKLEEEFQQASKRVTS